MDARVDGLRDGVLAAGEALRLNVRRRRHIGRLRSVDESIRQIDYAVRNVRVLARAGVTLSRLHTPAAARAGCRPAVAGRGGPAGRCRPRRRPERAGARPPTGTPPGPTKPRSTAVHTAGQLFGSTQTLPLAMIIGQIRATAIDLLRGVNPEDDAAVLARVDEALGLPAV